MSSPSQTTGGGDNSEGNHLENCANRSHNSRSELEISLARIEVIRSGRGIRRLVSLCGTIRQLVEENDQRLLSLSDSNSDDEDQEASQPPQDPEELAQRRDRNWRSFQALVKLIPGFKQKISEPSEILRSIYYTQLLSGANSARSDDNHRIKPKIAEWFNSRPGIPDEQRVLVSERKGRGLQHDLMGKLLCPIKYDWDNPSIRTKVRDETDDYSASTDYWIRCLYEGEEGNPADVEKGFLQSDLLVKTFKVIFTSPSSADCEPDERNNRPRRGKSTKTGPPKQSNNAVLHQMDGNVTPCAIAYAAVQLHFNLTDATHWASYYNGFNYEEFYEFIVDFFEADTTPEAQEASMKLLEWWNRKVFPRSETTHRATPRSARRTSLAIIRQQRATARSSNPLS